MTKEGSPNHPSDFLDNMTLSHWLALLTAPGACGLFPPPRHPYGEPIINKLGLQSFTQDTPHVVLSTNLPNPRILTDNISYTLYNLIQIARG
jgi:hypothetical protein